MLRAFISLSSPERNKEKFIIGIGLYNCVSPEVSTSAIRRTRKPSGIIQSKFEGLRTRGVVSVPVWVQWPENWRPNGMNLTPSPKAHGPERPAWGQKMRAPSQPKCKSSLPLPFCSVEGLSSLDDDHLDWRGWKDILPILKLIFSHNILTDMPNVWPVNWAFPNS